MGRGEAAKARTGDGLPSSRKAGWPGEEATHRARLSPVEQKERSLPPLAQALVYGEEARRYGKAGGGRDVGVGMLIRLFVHTLP